MRLRLGMLELGLGWGFWEGLDYDYSQLFGVYAGTMLYTIIHKSRKSCFKTAKETSYGKNWFGRTRQLEDFTTLSTRLGKLSGRTDSPCTFVGSSKSNLSNCIFERHPGHTYGSLRLWLLGSLRLDVHMHEDG